MYNFKVNRILNKYIKKNKIVLFLRRNKNILIYYLRITYNAIHNYEFKIECDKLFLCDSKRQFVI